MDAQSKWRNTPTVVKVAAVPVTVLVGAAAVTAQADALPEAAIGAGLATVGVVAAGIAAGKALSKRDRIRRTDRNKMHLPALAALDTGMRDLKRYDKDAGHHLKLAVGAAEKADRLTARQTKSRVRQLKSDRTPSKFHAYLDRRRDARIDWLIGSFATSHARHTFATEQVQRSGESVRHARTAVSGMPAELLPQNGKLRRRLDLPRSEKGKESGKG